MEGVISQNDIVTAVESQFDPHFAERANLLDLLLADIVCAVHIFIICFCFALVLAEEKKFMYLALVC